MCMLNLSVVSDSLGPMDCSCQAPLSMGFSIVPSNPGNFNLITIVFAQRILYFKALSWASQDI